MNHTLTEAANALWGKLRNGDQLNSAKATRMIYEVLEAIDDHRTREIAAARADRAVYRKLATDLCRRLKAVAYRNPSEKEMLGGDLSKRCIGCGGKANKHDKECKIQKVLAEAAGVGLGREEESEVAA